MTPKTRMDMEPMPGDDAWQPAPRKPARRRGLWRIGFIVVLIAALIGFGYYFVQYQRLSSDPSIKARAAAARAVKQLAEVMVVPDDPNPVVATVSDKQKL